MAHLIVIGGGITGVTSAYALARQGHQVTLIEKHRYAGMETSHANGGQLSASNAEVWTHPSTLIKGLKWMFKADAPLLLNPRPSWHKLSWFAEFAASMSRYRDNTVATTRLAIAAREHLFGWAQDEGIEFDLKQRGILHIYRSRASFEHASQVSRLLAQGGLTRRAVTPDEMRAIEPTLRGEFFGGWYTESDSTGDIHKFTHGLGLACARLGVKFMTAQAVARVWSSGKRVRVLLASGDEYPRVARVQIAREIGIVLLPIGRRHQHRDVPPDDLGLPVAEEPFGRRIEQLDARLRVDDDDAVDGRVDERLQYLPRSQVRVQRWHV